MPKFAPSNIQNAVTDIQECSEANRFGLHQKKRKELRIDLKKTQEFISSNRNQPWKGTQEIIEDAKLLGFNNINNLSVQLQWAKVPDKVILQFYSLSVRPILEYASTVFYYALPKYLSDEIERVQKGALRIVSGLRITGMN